MGDLGQVPNSAGPSRENRVPFWKTPWPWAFLIGAASLLAIRPLQEAVKTAPPPLVKPGAWELTDHEGKPFSSNQLKGKVWIANFVFTRCPSICPALTQSLKQMHQSLSDLQDKVAFASFSVDPEHDRPSILRDYRKKMDIEYSNWVFLTGEKDKVHHLLVKKFFMAVGEKKPLVAAKDTQSNDGGVQKPNPSNGQVQANELYDISHSSKLVLFDQNGDIRAYADANPLGMGSLANAARLLAKKGPNP
jgi:protein SCO1